MGVMRESTRTTFRCDIPGCGAEHVIRHGKTWDESRAAFPEASDAGWSYNKKGRKWQAFCPDCTSVGDYEDR